MIKVGFFLSFFFYNLLNDKVKNLCSSIKSIKKKMVERILIKEKDIKYKKQPAAYE
tara:strand:+ start:8988 stop:9155 length:168 start_codon:yes stop_codon:yes gene_type:complete